MQTMEWWEEKKSQRSDRAECNKNTKNSIARQMHDGTSIMATAMVPYFSIQACLRAIIIHWYTNVGSKHDLANHCRHKFYYHYSYAFPVQFKITEVFGDWFLSELLPRRHSIVGILDFLTIKYICRMFIFFWGQTHLWRRDWDCKQLRDFLLMSVCFCYFLLFDLWSCKCGPFKSSHKHTFSICPLLTFSQSYSFNLAISRHGQASQLFTSMYRSRKKR